MPLPPATCQTTNNMHRNMTGGKHAAHLEPRASGAACNVRGHRLATQPADAECGAHLNHARAGAQNFGSELPLEPRAEAARLLARVHPPVGAPYSVPTWHGTARTGPLFQQQLIQRRRPCLHHKRSVGTNLKGRAGTLAVAYRSYAINRNEHRPPFAATSPSVDATLEERHFEPAPLADTRDQARARCVLTRST